MIKNIKRAALLLGALLGVACMQAQQMPDIPVDKDVKIGKLPNGLTYYIRHNETPKGQADFYIAQKVGSICENDQQRGLAHFLEHMCFNGTTSFPNNTLIDWLESVGVKFGYNLNAYTSIDETVYNISNVPTQRTSVQDSCLLILHDWANDLLLDPEEIDKERGVIHEEWRRSNVGQMRILTDLLPVLYPDSRYGYRLPIGTMEVIDNFEPQTLRDYYEAWYRPDLQGIIIVGDIDVDYIEGKIKEMFSDIEMPANAQERVYFPVADTPGTIYAIGSDPEMTVGVIEMDFKTDPMPDEMKSNMQYLLFKFMTNMMATMLNQRLSDLGMKPDAPFAQADVSYGDFIVSKTKDAVSLSTVAKGNDVLLGFEAAYRELLRAARGGFTVGEYERAKAEYLSRLEKAYNGRDKRQSGDYVREYVKNFIDNEPIPSIEDEYQIMSQLVNMIPVDAINTLLPEIITNDNRSVLGLFPANGEFKVPTEAEIAAVIASVDAENIEPYKDEMKSEPLIPQLPVPGKVVSVTDDTQWGAKAIMLSNGIKVIVKNTDYKKDEIVFTAIAPGGSSTIPDTEADNLKFMPVAMSTSGLGEYTNVDMQKYLQGKQVSLDYSIEEYMRSLDGHSTVKDLPTLMEMIYMTFVDYTIAPEEYEATKNMVISVLANQEANPQFIFQKTIAANLYESAASQPLTAAAAEAANCEQILKLVRNTLLNAADFTFFFVGDVTVEQITPLLEQYIATLPAIADTAAKGYQENLSREIKPGSATDISTTKMETPQTWCAIIIEGTMPYTSENAKIASIIGQILSNRLLKKVREEMGATYSISAGAYMMRAGHYNVLLQIPFPMKPEMREQVLAEIDKIINGMCDNITPDELNPIKEFMVKNAIEDKEQNSPWLRQMSGTAINGVDNFNNAVEDINAITIEKVQNFMKELMAQNNHRVIILNPEE